MATLPESFRNIDLLINIAELALGTAPAQNASLEQWNQMIETNIAGLVTITHRLLPTLITLPPHMNINRLELMPVSQSSPLFQFYRGAAA